MKTNFEAVERCPCKEALYKNIINNWTDADSERRISSVVIGISYFL